MQAAPFKPGLPWLLASLCGLSQELHAIASAEQRIIQTRQM
jgi:hypothetical protein